MTRLRPAWVAVAASLLLSSAACASPATSPDGAADSGAPPMSEAPVLRVEERGGFVTPEMTVARLPLVSVYDDGRVITQGPQILIYPGPALPNVQVTRIDPAAVRTLVDKAVAAGVRRGLDVGRPAIVDAPDTRFTVETETGRQVLDVPALVEAAEHTANLTAAQRAARERLIAFRRQLTDLPRTLGADKVKEPQPYRPTAIAAIATPWQAPADPGVSTPPAVDWPGPALPGESIGGADGLRCVIVDGEAANAVLAAGAKATMLTPWTSAGKRWQVTLRPLLPDEQGCDALSAGP